MKTNLNTLPKEVQEKVKNTLKAYNEVSVIYEDGKYNVITGALIKASYSNDYKVVGRYKASEVFTEEEMIINYVEEFKDYPSQYKGKRDYSLINSLEKGDKVKFNKNGDIVKA